MPKGRGARKETAPLGLAGPKGTVGCGVSGRDGVEKEGARPSPLCLAAQGKDEQSKGYERYITNTRIGGAGAGAALLSRAAGALVVVEDLPRAGLDVLV